jgi:hypothetical protein
MKKITLILAIICTHFIAIAQQPSHSPGLDKFVGTWVYTNEGSEFEIELSVATVDIPIQNAKMDVIKGFHSYKQNGKTLDNSRERNKTSIHGLVSDRTDPNVLEIIFLMS